MYYYSEIKREITENNKKTRIALYLLDEFDILLFSKIEPGKYNESSQKNGNSPTLYKHQTSRPPDITPLIK